MAFWLASQRQGQATGWIQRFDPRFWTVNFPRPMVAAVTTTAPDALRVDATFYTAGNLAGLIWASADTLDHPLLAYATSLDYSGTTLSFQWQSAGVIALDQINGPTLTITGNDASGVAHTWYVRLWNYAVGTPTNATITLPFSALAGGWTLGAGDDPVYPAAITSMFISLVPPAYAAGSTAPLAAPVTGWVALTGIQCTGDNAMLVIGDVVVPPNGCSLASDFDDLGTQTPARLIRNLRQLGYRGSVVHYIGFSHHFAMVANAGAPSGFAPVASGAVLNAAAIAWHANFLSLCRTAGLSPIISLSFELLAQNCPAGWYQQNAAGAQALTGWNPPSTLLSPASTAAMGWLQAVAGAFVSLMVAAGVPVRVQIGEPWWWIGNDNSIAMYDPAAVAALTTALGQPPATVSDLSQPLSSAQQSTLTAAAALLAGATAGIVSAVRAAAAPRAAEALLLVYLPTVLNPATPGAALANLPAGWAAPAFDRLQVEDYGWLTGGAMALSAAAYATVNAKLAYPPAAQDYFAGYVSSAAQASEWLLIDAGIDAAKARGTHEVFVWAAPQVCRDGYVRLPSTGADTMQAFDPVYYPLALGLDTKAAPEFSTAITITASGYERRNSLWGNALLRFDVGPGIRSMADIGTLVGFFRARRGAARGFLLTDPGDFSSNGMTGTPAATDQSLGTGDGVTASFQLIKTYGAAGATGDAVQTRAITRPQAASVLVAVNGVAVTSGWSLGAGGILTFTAAPAAGAVITAGYLFDVPVRFEQDRLQVSGASFAAGEAPSVPLVEIREAG